MSRCDGCDGAIPAIRGTSVSIILTAADRGQLTGTLCSIGCAAAWLAVTPTKLKGMRARLTAMGDPALKQHEKTLAAFEADDVIIDC